MAKSFPNTGTTVIDAVGDLPASPSEGMMVFQRDTNELKIYDGAVWRSMLDTDTPPGKVLVYANTWSGNPFDVTNVFTSAYANYYVEISNIGCASGVTTLLIQMIDSGGGVLGSGYASSLQYVTFAAATSGASFITNGFYGATIAASNAASMIRGWFSGPQTATHTGYASIANSYDATIRSGGVLQNGTSYTGFRLATVSSASSSGMLRVYGMRDAI